MDLVNRRTKRFEYAAPATFWWSPGGGFLQSATGVTRDIGNTGVLIETSECPPPGVHIQVTVFLPLIEGSGYGMKLHGEGVVVRVEGGRADTDEQPTAFAASVHFYPEQVDPSEQFGKDSTDASAEAILFHAIRGTGKNCV